MNPHANMPHLQNQPNASHITSPNSPPSNRWMTNVVGNNGKLEISIVVVAKDNQFYANFGTLRTLLFLYFGSTTTFLSPRVSFLSIPT